LAYPITGDKAVGDVAAEGFLRQSEMFSRCGDGYELTGQRNKPLSKLVSVGAVNGLALVSHPVSSCLT
jgi:hypothetical protein